MAGAKHFVVITGGPGAGKSTLTDALGAAGFMTKPEAGRAIIQQQTAIGGDALPWRDRNLFAELMLAWDMRSYGEAEQAAGVVFFDRGIPDTVGYLELSGIAVPAHMAAAAERFRYGATVFVAPPWQAIYAADSERRQSFAEAVATCDALTSVYSRLGYRLQVLPLAPVEARVDFVLGELGLGVTA